MLTTEARFLKQLSGDENVCRRFLRGQPIASGASLIGWLSLVYFSDGDGALSNLQSRMLASQAVANACVLNVAADSPNEHLRLKSGHDLCPTQRSVAFDASLLQGVGIMTSFMVSGSLLMDFFLVQCEICTASLPKFIVDVALAHAKSSRVAACHNVHFAT